MQNVDIKAKFSCYDCHKFAQIMFLANVTPIEILKSLDTHLNRKNVFKAGQSAGKSGSFFFFTTDNRFIIKSMSKQEIAVLLKHLDSLI